MNRVASLLLVSLCFSAAACASRSGTDHPPQTTRPTPKIQSWTPIDPTDVEEPGLRQALIDLLMLVDIDVLWPGFALEDDPAIVVDAYDTRHATAYCIGHCVPRIESAGGTSRLWRTPITDPLLPGEAHFAPVAEWGLSGDGKAVALGFQRREQTVTVLLHEHFHLHYQTDYIQAFGDDIYGDSRPASGRTRVDLSTAYSISEPVRTELRRECAALVDALRAGNTDRQAAIAALHRFSATRDVRRDRPGAPSFEEDFWERHEGVPVLLERRIAGRANFADPSLIGTALADDGCEVIPDAPYFLMLGGLQGAVLDELSDATVWPHRVYPSDGTLAVSLYFLIRELLPESEKK